MKRSHLLSLSVVIGLFATSASADPPRTPSVTCNAGGLAAHPKFTQVSPGRAEYNFSGVCSARGGRWAIGSTRRGRRRKAIRPTPMLRRFITSIRCRARRNHLTWSSARAARMIHG